MKAWLVSVKDQFGATVVFAETRGKARSIAMHTDTCEDADFCDIEVNREPQLDKYYKEGKKEMDWYDSKDRIALVKECGFRCDTDYLERDDCECCPAKKYCGEYDAYQEKIADFKEYMGRERKSDTE